MTKKLLILSAFALFSCKKEKTEEISFPITMFAEKAEVVSDTKIHIKGGQLNDAQKAAELIWIYGPEFRQEQNLTGAAAIYLNFVAKDSVTFFNVRSPYFVERAGDRLMMTSTVQFMEPIPLMPDQSKDVRLAYGSNYNELKIPMFAYVVSSRIATHGYRLDRRGGFVMSLMKTFSAS